MRKYNPRSGGMRQGRAGRRMNPPAHYKPANRKEWIAGWHRGADAFNKRAMSTAQVSISVGKALERLAELADGPGKYISYDFARRLRSEVKRLRALHKDLKKATPQHRLWVDEEKKPPAPSRKLRSPIHLCTNCNENAFRPETTWQQWQCPACGHWHDRKDIPSPIREVEDAE